MFHDTIRNTPLTTEEANLYFQDKIYGDSFNRDVSFLATLRALLGQRLPEGEYVRLKICTSSFSESDIRGSSTQAVINAIFGREDFSNTLTVRMMCGPHNGNKAALELFEREFEANRKGWQRLEKVTIYLKKWCSAQCFLNHANKAAFLLVENIDMGTFHIVESAAPALFPWYIDPKTITPDELEFIKSLNNRTSEAYIGFLSKCASQYDFRDAFIRLKLKGIESVYERRRAEEMEREISNIDNNIMHLSNDMASYLRQRRDREATLLGLQLKINQAQDSSELMEYFLCNKHLKLLAVEGTSVRFSAFDYLTFYDEDMASRMISNHSSYVYNYCSSGGITAEDMEMLMNAIFIDQTLKVKFVSEYSVSLEGSVGGVGHYYDRVSFPDYMPNPHIYFHSCLGSHRQFIQERLTARDYIGAIEQCISSAKSLNFGDSTVMKEFMHCICSEGYDGTNNHCIELPDGTITDPTGAIAFLKSEKEAADSGEDN